VTPTPGSIPSIGTGPISWDNLTRKEQRQLERAQAKQLRRSRQQRGGRVRWYTVLLAVLLVVAAWFTIGILAGVQIQRQEALAALMAARTQTAAFAVAEAATAAAQAEMTIQGMAVETLVADTPAPTEAAPTTLPPTPTLTPTPTATPIGGARGQIALVSDQDGDPEIFLLDLATGNLRQMTRNTVEDSNPAWSADGLRLAFASAETRAGVHIIVINADGTNRREITQGNRVDRWPVWSPAGGRIVFHSVDGGRSFLRAVTLGGEEETLVQIPRGDNTLFNWSADEQRVTYFGFSPRGTLEILYLDVATDTRTPITDANGLVDFVDFSPDGSKVVFTRFINVRQRQIYLADNDPVCRVITDCNTVRLTNDEFDYRTPRFSPDGTLLLASSNQRGNLDLFLLDLAGNVVQRLTSLPSSETDGMWQP